jgi:hypothetical protein
LAKAMHHRALHRERPGRMAFQRWRRRLPNDKGRDSTPYTSTKMQMHGQRKGLGIQHCLPHQGHSQ